MGQLRDSIQANTLDETVTELERIADKLDHLISAASNAGLHASAVQLSGIAHDLEHERRQARRQARRLRDRVQLAEITELLRPVGVVIPIREG